MKLAPKMNFVVHLEMFPVSHRNRLCKKIREMFSFDRHFNWQLDLMRLNEFYKWIRSLHSLRPHDVTDSDTTHFIDRIAVPTTTTTATAQCTEHNIVAFAKLLLAGGEPFSCELHYVATILRRWHNSHLAYYQLRRSCRHTMSHRSHYYRRPFYVLYANRSVQRTPLTRT